MNDEIEEMCKAAVDAINVSYEDYDQDSDLYEGFMEGFNAAWKQLTAERDRLRKALEDIVRGNYETYSHCCQGFHPQKKHDCDIQREIAKAALEGGE